MAQADHRVYPISDAERASLQHIMDWNATVDEWDEVDRFPRFKNDIGRAATREYVARHKGKK